MRRPRRNGSPQHPADDVTRPPGTSEINLLSQDKTVAERSILQGQLANAIALRGYETSISWGVFAVFGATNAALLNMAIQGPSTSPTKIELVATAAGLVFSTFWFAIQKRVIAYIDRYDALITRLENRLGIADEFALSLQINHKDRSTFITGFSARKVMLVAVSVVIAAWVAVLLVKAVQSIAN